MTEVASFDVRVFVYLVVFFYGEMFPLHHVGFCFSAPNAS